MRLANILSNLSSQSPPHESTSQISAYLGFFGPMLGEVPKKPLHALMSVLLISTRAPRNDASWDLASWTEVRLFRCRGC